MHPTEEPTMNQVYAPLHPASQTTNMVSPEAADMLEQISANEFSEQERMHMGLLFGDDDKPYECLPSATDQLFDQALIPQQRISI